MSGTGLAGQISEVGAWAAGLGVRPGDELLAVNGHEVQDVLDVLFHAAEPELELLIRRGARLLVVQAERDPSQPLDITFEYATFDVDVRRCNNRCPFCFVAGMGPKGARGRFRRTLYIKDDDYRYSFLEGNYVTLTNLREQDWQRIEEQRLSPLYVSVHATEQELRRKLLGNPEAPDILVQLRRLAGFGIQVHTQLVIIPGVNDGPHLERSLDDLAPLWPAVQSVSVVPVGLTRLHPALPEMRLNTPACAEAMLDWLHHRQERLMASLGDRFVYATDEWYLLAGRPVPPMDHYRSLDALRENGVGLVREFLDEWKALAIGPAASCARSLTLVTGVLFAPILRHAAAGLALDVRAVANTTLGESITVAGLLLARDVIAQLKRGGALGEQVLLPRVMFRGPDETSLDDMKPADVAAALGRPVTLAASMADVVQACGLV
jgi:putative radical SAM enzyme (TIGR03279 family)